MINKNYIARFLIEVFMQISGRLPLLMVGDYCKRKKLSYHFEIYGTDTFG